jgi:hypothetical protein
MNDTAHEHAFDLWASFYRAPIDAPYPAHTMFEAFVCPCGAYQVFPRGNFAITTQAFRRRFAAEATALGFFEAP